MTQSEPMIPGTAAAVSLVVLAFVLMISGLVGGLYGLFVLANWAVRLA